MVRRDRETDFWHRLPRKWISSPYSLGELAGVIRRNILGPVARESLSVPFLSPSTRWSEGPEEFTVCFTGDWMPLGGRELDFGEGLGRFFADADVVVCNFEGVSIPGGRPVVMQQVHGAETLRALARLAPAQRIVLSCANNHSADHGYAIFHEHCLYLESLGYRVAGRLNQREVPLAPGIILEAGTDWSNHPGPFLATPELRVRRPGTPREYRILYVHWGHELELYPRGETIRRARDLLAGRDLIVGHHPHTPSPFARVHSEQGDFPVGFSLGNFCTVSRAEKNRWGMVARAVLGRERDGVFRLRRLDWRFSHVRRNRGRILVQLEDRCRYFPDAPRPRVENPEALL